MSFVNNHTKKINCKIVYFGPGLGGKTSNVQYVYQKTSGDHRGKMITLNTENERTLFFDFLPLELGKVRGYEIRFHLYTVPGQVFYEASRKLILRGVDGIVFVADSQTDRFEDNLESLTELERCLLLQNYEIKNIPLVFQWNKRDLPDIKSVKELNSKLNKWGKPHFEAEAINGRGVFESLKMLTKMVLLNVKGGLKAREKKEEDYNEQRV